MLLVAPTPLEEALRLLREKRLVPTALSSTDLRELAADVKRAALFSARMTQMRPLQALAEGLTAMLEGTGNVADAKLLLSEVYAALGYDAEAGGFPQDAPGTVEPATRGTLRDLNSQRRMELTITTNYRMVANEAFVKRTTEDEQRRYQFPCYELVRIEPRITPRGFIRRKGGDLDIAPGEDWPSRFVAAGGELYEKGTRMIAPKGSDVWVQLGAGAGGYKDTLGNPFAPFAFHSGYGLRELPRGECLLIGVITEEDVIAKMPVTLQGALKAQAKQIDPKILAAFDDLEDDGEWLRLAKAKQDKVEAARKLRNRVAWIGDALWNARVKNPSETVRKGWVTHHVDSKRGQLAIKMLPRVLVKGRIGKHEDPEKRYVRYAGWTAVVKKRQTGRWSVTTLIDDNIAPKQGTKNARLPFRSTEPTTQVRTGLEFPGSTHACQLFAETGAGAAKTMYLSQVRARCKLLAQLLHS